MSDLIAAVATARGSAAIGILRLSGEGAVETADSVFEPVSGRALASYADRTLVYGSLHDVRGRVIDWCLATVSRAPHISSQSASHTFPDTLQQIHSMRNQPP